MTHIESKICAKVIIDSRNNVLIFRKKNSVIEGELMLTDYNCVLFRYLCMKQQRRRITIRIVKAIKVSKALFYSLFF